jgi:hypothetical protein
MKKAIKNIMSIILAGLFLITFAGVRLLLHQCMKCESTDLAVLTSSSSCCQQASAEDALMASCCTIDFSAAACCTDQSENCCQDEVVFLKNDYELVNEKQQSRIEPHVSASLILAFSLFDIIADDSDNLSFLNYNQEKPPLRAGRDFVIFSHQIKIG